MFSLFIDSKLPLVGTTIFTVMSALAREEKAINLSQGFPDFRCDPLLLELVNKYMLEGKNQYAPMPGLMVLRESIASLVEAKYGRKYDPATEITVTSGATEALFCAITALVQEDDEVLIIEPAYDCYIPAIQLSGGSVVSVSLNPPDYSIDWDHVKKLVSQRTKLIILNSPHNPTGSSLKEEDIQALRKIVQSSNCFILSDEVYEHIIFDGATHHSMARYPDLAERSLIISSFGKSLHTTGWKIGYCLAPKYITKEFRKVHQFVTFSTSTPFQYAIAEYIEDHDRIHNLAHFYQRKRDLFLQLMEGSRFTPVHCSGTYFQTMSYEGISDLPDTEFAKWLTREHKVASIPLSVFYRTKRDNKVLRFCFAKQESTLEEAAMILRKV